MKLIKVYLVSFVFLVSFEGFPQVRHHTVRADSSKIVLRAFNKITLEKFKADPAYRYGRPQEGLTPWQRFLIWVGMILARFIYFVSKTLIGQILFFALCGAVILYVILKVLNIEVKDLFYRSSVSSRIDFRLTEENIHNLDFERLIQETIGRKEYRDAVRLIFLFSLKKLSETNLIQWVPGKTNDEYLFELQQHPARPHLQELRYYFDYAWYGHFEINRQTFEDVNKTFEEFKTCIQ